MLNLCCLVLLQSPEGLWRRVAVTVGLFVSFLWLPFSLRSTPRTLYEL